MKSLSALALFVLLGMGLQTQTAARGWQSGPKNTYGYTMMTPEERAAHQQKMRGMQSLEECNAYMTEHRQAMMERARQQNLPVPPMRGDPCAMMKARGWIK